MLLTNFYNWFNRNKLRAVHELDYPQEISGIRLRFKRRRNDWQPHLNQTKKIILQGVEYCTQRRKAVLIGAALLHDIPLEELASQFREVLLIDVYHPFWSFLKNRRFRNVFRINFDITEYIDLLVKSNVEESLPLVPLSKLYLEDPEIDLVVSVNVLSQLPCMPIRFLEKNQPRTEQELDQLAKDLILAHLSYLDLFSCQVVLITDIEMQTINVMNNVVARKDLMYGINIFEDKVSSLSHSATAEFDRIPTNRTDYQEWEWRLAPCPEVNSKFSYFRKVVGFTDWKKYRLKSSA